MSDPIPAASIILTRGIDTKEIFLVRRSDTLRFFGGFTAFPGGKVSREDHAIAVDEKGITPSLVAGVRELFEETGILLARPSLSIPNSEILNTYRRGLLDNRCPFPQILQDLQLTLDPSLLESVGSLITPPFSVLRFDTEFYLAQLPAGQLPDIWSGELSEGWWTTVVDALRDWKQGKTLLSPPTVFILQTIANTIGSTSEVIRLQEAFNLSKTEPIPTISILPGVLLIPLVTRGLPPATHTNAYLIGESNRYLIDPGPVDEAEQDQLIHFLHKTLTVSQPLRGVILTHHHPDHVGSAKRVAHEFQVPIWAHPITADLLKNQFPIDHFLVDGQELDLGRSENPLLAWKIQAIFTPGHAPGHLVLIDNLYDALFAGDMISGISTVVVIHPDGDLTQYLTSLSLLKKLSSRILLPGHGSPTARPDKVLSEAIRNRELRENQILQSISGSPRSVEEITLEVYRGLGAKLIELAEKQTYTGLLKLQSEGKVVQTQEMTWCRAIK